jgi:beta-galactosidase
VKVIARPGPHINAEMTYFSYPERLFADEELMARCADGAMTLLPAPPRMFPLPCYHHPRFQAEVRTYFDALADATGGAGAVYPDGPIIAIQADNECAKFMRANPFDWDYSEYAIRLYRKWLQEKYERLDELNRVHRCGYRAWQLVDAPRRLAASRREDLPRVMDWVEFGEHYINTSIRDVAVMLQGLFGAGVPLFHNYPRDPAADAGGPDVHYLVGPDARHQGHELLHDRGARALVRLAGQARRLHPGAALRVFPQAVELPGRHRHGGR